MKKKFILQVVAWLLTVAMLLPSAGAALTTAYAAGEKAAYEGSVTYAASGEWAEKEITMKDLIGSVDPDDVAYISFTSDVKFNIGYNPADHSSWKWANYSTKHDVTDIALDDWFAFKFALNANDGKNYTIKWSVYTGDAKTPAQEQEEQDKNANVVHSGSATFSDDDWWTNYEITDRSALIGDVNPEEIAYVKFTCDTGFLLGYNNGAGYYQLDSDSPVTTYVARDINWDITAYYLQLILSKGNGVEYTIKWDVVSKIAATPTPTPTPTATPTPTPVPKYTDVGETLTVTEDMVKDGVVTIKNAQYNEIIVPAGLGITKINFNVIDVDKLVFEGGENYTVTLRNALVEETEIAASKVEAMTYEELVEELDKAKKAEDASAAINAVANAFIASLQAKSKAADAQIKLSAYDSELDAINVKANARIDVTEATVNALEVSTKDAVQRMEVRVTGFDGDATVDLDKGGRTYNAPLNLNFRSSAVNNLAVSGEEVFHVEGSKSTVDTMTLSGVDYVSSNLDAANLVVDEKNENANVRIYADVSNLIVEGEKNDVVLPACASIDNAIVAGDNIRVYGLGDLGNAEVTGTGANVATIGTAVEGENDTTMPQAMIDMLPTATPVPAKPTATPIPLEGAAYAGGGMFYDGGNNYWNQYGISQEDILGPVAPEEVDHIIFTSKLVNIVIGYNPIGDSNWTNTDADGAKQVVVMGSDIEKFDSINVILRNETKKDQEVIWRVYTTPYVEEEKDPNAALHTFTYDEYTAIKADDENAAPIFNIKLLDYLPEGTKLAAKNKVKIVATLTGDADFTANLGASVYAEGNENGSWSNMKQGKGPGTTTIEVEFEIPHAKDWVNAQLQIWYMAQTAEGITVDSITVEKLGGETDSEGDNKEDNEADADYVGDWGEGYKFAADVFADLTGEVTVALQYRTVSTATDYQIKAYERTDPWKDLVPADYAKTDYSVNSKYNTMSLNKTEGTVSFTLTADAVERIKTNAKGIGIQVYNVIIEDATVTGSKVEDKPTTTPTVTPGGNIPTVTPGAGGNTGTATDDAIVTPPADDEDDTPTSTPTPTPLVTTLKIDNSYSGGGNNLSNSIPAGVFAQYTGAVLTVTVNYAVTGSNEYPWFKLISTGEGWPFVPTSIVNSFGGNSCDKSKTSVTFTVNKSDVPSSTLAFQVDGLYVTSVTISGEGEANADANYAGNYAIGRKVFASELADYADNSLIVTVSYTKTQQEVDYYQAALVNGGTEITGYTHASADSGSMEFVLSADLVNDIIADSSYLGVKANGLIIDAVFVQKKEGLTAPATIYSGSVESGDWATSLNIEGSKFAGCAFDGTEVLIINHTSTDTTAWGTSFKLATTDDYTVLLDAVNRNIASESATKEVVLTEDYEVIVAKGLQIQGFNWTITSVQLAKKIQVYGGSVESGNWATSLNLEKSKFADYAFDGTEELVIIFSSTDTDAWGSQFQLVSGETKLLDCENQSMAAFPTSKSVVLTEAYEVIKTGGLDIQGFNWTVTEVFVRLK
ncbi:MAG: hypothetical protein IJ353_05235 [Lachnospiraceae bacterium]|nr:hypothetical protein [Lachnospiraceae bacterium]